MMNDPEVSAFLCRLFMFIWHADPSTLCTLNLVQIAAGLQNPKIMAALGDLMGGGMSNPAKIAGEYSK